LFYINCFSTGSGTRNWDSFCWIPRKEN